MLLKSDAFVFCFVPQSSYCFLKKYACSFCQRCPVVSVVLRHVFVPGRLVDTFSHVYRMIQSKLCRLTLR